MITICDLCGCLMSSGMIFLPSNRMPLLIRSKQLCENGFSSSTSYVLVMLFFGCAILFAISPSLVKMIRPCESRSSLPTGNTRGLFGTRSRMVARPFSSDADEMYRGGLLRA